MDSSDLPFLPVSQLCGLIESRDVSPVEVTEAYLDRIKNIDSIINSYVTVSGEEALDSAREAEQAITAGNYLGPMHGIPVAVKDQIYTEGILTTGGSNILSDFVPQEDATVVTNLKKAGAVLLGKLNLSEFAVGGSFHHPAGTPHNPWSLDRNPGTSSSGSGAATAAFLCATSLGEDTAGSIRIPAAWCGIVGLRPTWGRVSRYGVLPICWSMDAVGPVSRTVEDCSITMRAIAGHDPKDPYTWNVPVPDYRDALDGDIRNLRVGVVKEKVYAERVHPDVRDAVLKAIDALAEMGAIVEEVSLPLFEEAGAVSKMITDIEGAMVHHDWLRTRASEYDHNTRVRLSAGAIAPAHAYYKAQKIRALLRRQVLEELQRVDLLVLPTTPTAAPRIPDGPGIKSPAEAREAVSGVRSFTGPFNLAGTPALALPCGFDSHGLPVSLQLSGRPFEEGTLLRVGYAYEQNTTWHLKRPPI